MISITYSTKFLADRVLSPKTKLSPHFAPPQPPTATERSHIVPTTHTHHTADYGATPLLMQVDGGCYSQGEVVSHHFGGVDLHMDIYHPLPPYPSPPLPYPYTFSDLQTSIPCCSVYSTLQCMPLGAVGYLIWPLAY